MTADLRDLVDWLAASQVTHIAMESTGCTGFDVLGSVSGRDF
jgi:hypothetical protein